MLVQNGDSWGGFFPQISQCRHGGSSEDISITGDKVHTDVAMTGHV